MRLDERFAKPQFYTVSGATTMNYIEEHQLKVTSFPPPNGANRFGDRGTDV